MDGQANFLAEWEALGDWHLAAEYYERTMSATPAQVRDAAARSLTASDVALLVYRPSAAPVFAADTAAARALLAEGCERVAPAHETPRAPAVLARDGAAFDASEHGIDRFRTRGNVPVLVKSRPGAPLVHLGVFTLGGVTAEPNASVGVSTLLVRGALKGTALLTGDQIAEVSESLGTSISPSVSPEMSGWTLSVPAGRFAEATALLAHVVQQPTFVPAAIDTERAIALAQLEQLRDDMMRYPIRLAMQAAFQGHPYARLTLGDEETLVALSAPDVAGWHRDHVLRGHSVIVIVGDVDPVAAARSAGRAFADLSLGDGKTPSAPSWPLNYTVRTEARDKAQSALALAFRGPDRKSPARFTADVLTSIVSGLGGRFFDELRDRQSLAYTVHVHALQRRHAGAIVAYIATSPDKEEAARAGLLAEFAKLRSADVTSEELERAKNYLIGSHAIARQSGASVLGEIVDAWLLGEGLAELEKYESAIRGVSAADIRALSMDAFAPEQRVEGVVRGSTSGK